VAGEMIRDVDASGHWPGRTVTNISECPWCSGRWGLGIRTTSCGSRTVANPHSLGRTTSPRTSPRLPSRGRLPPPSEVGGITVPDCQSHGIAQTCIRQSVSTGRAR
jgi:hypothetical protein